MFALRWAAVPVLAGVLAGNVAPVAADEPAPAPTPTPTPSASDPTPTPGPDATPSPTPEATPSPTPIASASDPASTPTSEATPIPPVTGNVVYVTTTTTTTIVNAPITVVAAPITTSINTTNASTSSTAPGGLGQRVVMDLAGCGQGDRPSPSANRDPVRRAQVRLAPNATLVIRVNGKRVTSLRLPSTAVRGVALRVRLARDGMLTIRRPSGLVAAVQACAAA